MFDLNDNNQLCLLSNHDKALLLNFLKDYYIEYRDTIGLDKNMTFGIEIECMIPNIGMYMNYADVPFSVKLENSIVSDGFEFISPIMSDNITDWKQVKKNCDSLKLFGKIDDFCGGHIHYGAQIFENNLQYLLNFLFLWVSYEDIIYRFGNGEMLNTRRAAKTYAYPITKLFKKRLMENGIPTSTRNFLWDFKNKTKEFGLNFYNYFLYFIQKTEDKNTVEIRTPNGTLEEVIWQNNINFFGKMIEKSLNYDIDLNYVTNGNDLNNDNPLINYNKINIDKALELADLIFDNNLDKFNFLKQYIKDENETSLKTLVKAKRFWI